MLIKWYGQACFYIETENGIKILTDPYEGSLGYRLPAENADIITVSHNHFDHSATDTVTGNPQIFDSVGKFNCKEVQLKVIKTWHDKVNGKKRGPNRVVKIMADNINFVHMGDIGHKLDRKQVHAVCPCDICAVPVGGYYTVDAVTAFKIVKQLKPKLVIPMHYFTPKNRLELEGAGNFTKRFMEVKKKKVWSGSRKDLPRHTAACQLTAHGELDLER